MANLFLLSRKAFVMCYCFRAPIKTFFFWRLSNDCQIVRPALVSGPPNRKKPIINILLASFFSVCTVNYGSSFFSSIRRKKTRIRNLQYGPKTRQIRGIYFLKFKNFQKKENAFILPELVSYRGWKKSLKSNRNWKITLQEAKTHKLRFPWVLIISSLLPQFSYKSTAVLWLRNIVLLVTIIQNLGCLWCSVSFYSKKTSRLPSRKRNT